MRLSEIREIISGKQNGPDVSFSGVSIDTRNLHEGDIFIAISGPNFDGNDFVMEAQNKQAKAIVMSRDAKLDIPSIIVEDGKLALGQIARFNRRLSDARIIALTGSQGKTTVKEMTAKILSQCGKTVSTRGNLNNEYGVPLSLLQINKEHDFAVIELGASGPGEISYTSSLVEPDIVHITNIAPTHIEGFGSLDGVNVAKSEIWKSLGSEGVAVINLDDKYSSSWITALADQKTVTVSALGDKKADYRIISSELGDDLTSRFCLMTPRGECQLVLALPGQHNIANAIAATALAMEAGADIEQVVAGLESMDSIKGRLQLRHGVDDIVIIDDSYNASPSSFRAAIDVLASLPGTKVIAMGDMGELGEEAVDAHKSVAKYAAAKGVNNLFCCGKLSAVAANEFGVNGRCFDDLDLLAAAIKAIPDIKKTVLVKGSRSAGMDKLVKILLAEGE